jgi:hypothetical protein
MCRSIVFDSLEYCCANKQNFMPALLTIRFPQHALAMAEGEILGRSPQQYTAVAGYAGSKAVGRDGKVCYHNAAGDSDYGQLGYSEAVGLRIPADKISAFAKPYFDLLVDGERADPQVLSHPPHARAPRTNLERHFPPHIMQALCSHPLSTCRRPAALNDVRRAGPRPRIPVHHRAPGWNLEPGLPCLPGYVRSARPGIGTDSAWATRAQGRLHPRKEWVSGFAAAHALGDKDTGFCAG